VLIVFRVDASNKIGLGHLYRCLNLAKLLKNIGSNVIFICSGDSGYYRRYIDENLYSIEVIDGSRSGEFTEYDWVDDAHKTTNIINNLEVDLLIVDHYDLDYRWEISVSKLVKKIFVIDDLAQKKHYCDFILNHACTAEHYQGLLIKKDATILCGLEYVPINNKFYDVRELALVKRKSTEKIKNILIFMGGADSNNITSIVIDTIKNIESLNLYEIKVLLPITATYFNYIKEKIKSIQVNIDLIPGSDNMAELCLWADLCIGSGGMASWERCVLGLPSIVKSINNNQDMSVSLLEKLGGAITWNNNQDLCHSINEIRSDAQLWHSLSTNSAKICDGLGLERIIREIT